MAEHDKSYKKLFSHPQMVEDLLRGFVHEQWVNQLDFSTLEMFKDSFVSPNLKERHDDIIWRVRWGKKWLYVYLLLEFQSTIDHFMAVRIMVYIGLLYQYLIDTQKLNKKDKLPAVLPLVLYNGSDEWNAPLDISKLITTVPGGLNKYRPSLSYFLIDESTYKDSQLSVLHNLVAALIRLENTRSLENEQAVAKAISEIWVVLMDWLNAPELARLKEDFVVWLLRVLLPRNVPLVQIPEVVELQEVNDMLYETMQRLYQKLEERGEKRGEERGKKRGKAEMLIQLLETKFGALDAKVQASIEKLDSEALLNCSKRLFTAQTLKEVIG